MIKDRWKSMRTNPNNETFVKMFPVLIVIGVIAISSGCGAIRPSLYDEKLAAAATCQAGPRCVDSLLDSVRQVQITWNANYLKSAKSSDGYSTVLIGLAVAAAGAVLFKASDDAVAAIGLAAGGGTLTRNYWAPPGLDLTYVSGHKALTCFMSNSSSFGQSSAVDRDDFGLLAVNLEQAIVQAEAARAVATTDVERQSLDTALQAARTVREYSIAEMQAYDGAYPRLLSAFRLVTYAVVYHVRSNRRFELQQLVSQLQTTTAAATPPPNAVETSRATGVAEGLSNSVLNRVAPSSDLAQATLAIMRRDRRWAAALGQSESCYTLVSAGS
jgi:hypothetical protein